MAGIIGNRKKRSIPRRFIEKKEKKIAAPSPFLSGFPTLYINQYDADDVENAQGVVVCVESYLEKHAQEKVEEQELGMQFIEYRPVKMKTFKRVVIAVEEKE